jgi:hypothetical protein
MTSIQQPPAGPRDRSVDSGDLDGLLKAFFHSQVPDPWPAWQPGEKTPVLARKIRWAGGGRTLRIGRSVLAASVLLLLIGQLALTRLAPGPGSWQPADSGDGAVEATHRPGDAPARPRQPLSNPLGKTDTTRRAPGQ